MATIVTRAGKGSALTWTEGDANITNLNAAKIENVIEDTTPQLGGNLDVNGSKIVSTSNGNIALEPNGTGIVTANKNIETTVDIKAKEIWSTNSTGDEGGQINLAQAATNSTLGGDTVTIDIWQNRLRIFEQGGDARGVYIDLTAASAGVATNLLSGGGGITLTSLSVGSEGTASGDGSISYNNTTGVFTYTPPTAAGIGALVSGGALGTPSSGTVTNLTGTASININGTVGASTPSTGAFTTLTFKNPIEAIYNIGTTGGTIAPDPANGSVQQITLNSALTINAFTNPTAGESITLIIYGGTAYTSITSTMKFAGGIKTLTGTAGCIDILSIYFDGTTYFASLGKGYA